MKAACSTPAVIQNNFGTKKRWWSKRASPREPQISCCQRRAFYFRLVSQYSF